MDGESNLRFQIISISRPVFYYKKDKISLQRICVFLARLYVRAWFNSTNAISAPYHDYVFMIDLINYKNIDEELSIVTAKKFSNHLWYLAPENVALSLFDDNVPFRIKENMAKAIFEAEDGFENCNLSKKYILHENEYVSFKNLEFSSFLTTASKNLFKRFSINTEYLCKDPSTWKNDINYQNGLAKLKKLSVVNDVAERGVKLIQEYNNILTMDESERQFILQIAAEDRKKNPSCNKYSLMNN